MLTGENGILTKASIAKEKNAQKTVEEQVKLAVLASKTNVNAQINTAELETELTKYGITEITKGESGNLPWTVKKDEYEYTIEEEGVKELVYVKAEQIAANPKAYYGKKVENYKASENDANTYRIFYVSTNPEGEFGDQQYTVYLKADYSDTEYVLNTSYEANTKIEEMNPQWAEQRKGVTWNTNEKAVAYLCSPVNEDNASTTSLPWKEYFNEECANYVIGGPSIEMYVKSYNQTHDTENTLSAEYSATNYPGYIYKVNQELPGGHGYYTGSILDYSTTYNNMYCGKNGNKTPEGTGNWWLASPSSNQNYDICRVMGSYFSLNCRNYSNGIGLSPLVSLKSDFEIQVAQ